MSATLDRIDRAVLVQQVMEIRERCDRLLDVLLPDEALGCPHPPESIRNDSTMEDGGEQYTCTLCGTSQSTPFHHISKE